MTARLRTHHLLLLGIGSAAFAMAACAAPDVAHSVADTKETTQASSVVVDMQSASGTSLGTCSGTLISSKTVLTAGHCIAGVKAWSITAGAKTVKGSVGSTSWTTFGSDLSHPEHSDVGLITLDAEIKLSSYPSIATKVAADGTKGIQFHRASDTAKSFSSTAVTLQAGAGKGFRLNYLISSNSAFVDPGAAVLDSNNNIVGVVSGKGNTSGLLHVARVENFRSWAKSAIACGASLAVRDWGSGNSDNGGAGYGGTPSTSSSSGGGWGGWGGGSSSGGWGASSGGYGGGDGSGNGNNGSLDGGSTVPGSSSSSTGGTGTPTSTSSSSSSTGGTGTPTTVNGGDGTNTCPGAPVCEGSDCGAGASGLNGGTGSSTPSSSGGTDNQGTTGSSTVQNPNGGTTTTTHNPNGTTTVTTTTPGPNGTTTVSVTKNPNGTTTTTVTSPNGTSSTATTNPDGSPGTPGTSGATPGTGEGCSGSQDNNQTCPTAPDSATCASASCGACAAGAACADITISYGACGAGACGASASPSILK